MLYFLIYVIALVILYIKFCNFKEALKRSVIVAVFCIVAFILINFCFNNMDGVKDLFIDTKVYEIASVNNDTIVYIDDNDNLAVISKENVMVIQSDHTIKSWLTCMQLKAAGKALVVSEFPEDWDAYVVPRDNLK